MDFPHQQLTTAVERVDIGSFSTMLQTIKDKGYERNDEITLAVQATPGNLYVYKHMLLNIKSTIKIKRPEQIHGVKVRIAPMLKMFKQDFKVPQAADHKWGDVYRAKRTLEQRAITSTPKYIRSVLKHTITDHELRDLAEAVEYNMAHADIKVIIAKTPEEYVEMHEAGGSCMSTNSTYYRSTSVRSRVLQDLGLWPSLFYAYCPQLQGVYMKMHDKPVSRALILDGKRYGSLYHSGAGSHNKMVAWLKAEGYQENPYSYKVKITEAFDIPAVTWKGHKLCPVPTCDNLEHSYYVTYNKKADTFTVGPKGDHHVGYPYGFAGWVSSEGKPATELRG